MFRRSGDALRAVECALTLAITYKANFANTAVANGWTRRAERLLEGQPEGPAHAFMWLTSAYRMADLDTAEATDPPGTRCCPGRSATSTWSWPRCPSSG